MSAKSEKPHIKREEEHDFSIRFTETTFPVDSVGCGGVFFCRRNRRFTPQYFEACCEPLLQTSSGLNPYCWGRSSSLRDLDRYRSEKLKKATTATGRWTSNE